MTANPFHIDVSLSAHTITVTNANSVVYTGPVAVGAPDTPTPIGTFYLYVLLQAPDPTGPYGPYAYGLSSHSDALETFAGGDAEIGIHGNDDASDARPERRRTDASASTTPPSPTWRNNSPSAPRSPSTPERVATRHSNSC